MLNLLLAVSILIGSQEMGRQLLTETRQKSVETSRPLTVSEADQFAYQDIMRSWPRLGFAIFHHRPTNGPAMEIAARPWMIQPYKENAAFQVFKKASQIGVTELEICDLFGLASQGVSGIYVFPTDRWRNEEVANRLDRLINRVPFYAANCGTIGIHKKDVQARGIKTIFGSVWKFVGSEQINNFFGTPAQGLIIDEYDRCNQANLVYALDRLAAAANPRLRILGNPTIGGYGIDAKFADSNKNYWWTKCDKCGEFQRLDWFTHFIEQGANGRPIFRDSREDGDACPICSHCSEPFNRCGEGEWRAENPASKIAGYQLSRLFADSRTGLPVIRDLFVEWVAAQSNMTALQRFYNNILGETFEASGVKITEATLAGCVDPAWLPMAPNGTRVCGADIGLGLHTIIYEVRDGKLWQVFAGVCSDYGDLARCADAHGATVGVLDAGPEIHAPREFVRGRSGWYLCRYNLSDKLVAGKKTSHKDMHVDWVEKAVSVNRTESLDGLLADYQNGLMVLPAHYQAIESGVFARQMKVPTRIREDRPDGTFRYVWTKGEDHFFHASNYARIAARIHNSGSMILAG